MHPVLTPLSDQRIERISPLLSPALLRDELPCSPDAAVTVARGRDRVTDVLDGRDDRLLVVVGPCSVHDPDAALDYATRLAAHAERVSGELCVVMRTYFEKPRTTVGWKGLINDPGLDGTFEVNRGLRTARRLLLEVNALGLPVGCEFLDPITPQFIADTVTWGAIGARTAASQVHRQLVSGLSMPVGIKNGTDGDLGAAVDGVRAAAASHVFMGVNADGLAALVTTTGNPDAHVILRGGAVPNYSVDDVAGVRERLRAAGLPERVVVDASHGNSGKDHVRQAGVVREIAERIAGGDAAVTGLMMESFLQPGRQDLGPDLAYGRSVTDACLGWDTTAGLLDELAAAVRREGCQADHMLKGFKDFLLRGNVVDLAVAVVIGAAFTAVVTAFTSAFLKPLIQLLSGGGELAGTFVVNDVVFDYASFVNAVITFLLTAAVIYFLVVYPLLRIAERRKRGEESGPSEPTDVELLTEIRDLLREQRRDAGPQ